MSDFSRGSVANPVTRRPAPAESSEDRRDRITSSSYLWSARFFVALPFVIGLASALTLGAKSDPVMREFGHLQSIGFWAIAAILTLCRHVIISRQEARNRAKE